MVVLCQIVISDRQQFDNHFLLCRPAECPAVDLALNIDQCFLCGFLLGRRMVIDARTILRSGIVSLPIQSRGICSLEKSIQQASVRRSLWIISHLQIAVSTLKYGYRLYDRTWTASV